MNKLTLLASAMIIGACATASAETYYRLDAEEDSYVDAYRHFIWNADGTLQKIDEDVQGPCYRQFEYNDKKQCILDQDYQDVNNDGTYKLVNYAEYTYNENGLLATRTHYNDLPNENGVWEMQFQGIYYFFYNEQNQLTKREFYYDRNQKIKGYDETFTYNDKGQLTNMKQVASAISGDEVVDFEYTYDDKDRLVLVSESYVDRENVPRCTLTSYKYDENDDLVEILNGANLDNPQSKKEFTYSDTPIDRCIFPTYPDEQIFRSLYYDMMAHQPELRIDYVRVDKGESQELTVSGEWGYSYSEYDPETPNAIETVDMANGITLRGVQVVDGQLNLRGVNSVTSAYIYDTTGKMMMRAGTINGTLDVSSLAKGTYLMVSAQGAAKFVR